MTSRDNAAAGVDDPLSDQAIDWIVKLHSGHATAADAEAFLAWRAQTLDHEAAAQEAETLWRGLGHAGEPMRRMARRAVVTRRAVLGAGVLALGGLSAWGSGLLGPIGADVATGPGEQRTIALADGSRAELSGASALAIDFTANRRDLTLLAGQATFTVAHDPARPFIVSTSDGTARAIGTVFDVDHRVDQVVVTVLEGQVAVEDANRNRIELARNRQANYGPEIALSWRDIDAEQATAWRRGRLVFEQRRLDSVIAELGRYGGDQVIITNPRLAALELSGVFETNDPAIVLDTIGQTLPVSIQRLPFLTLIY